MEIPQEILNEVGNVYNYYLENGEMQVIPFWVIHKYFNCVQVEPIAKTSTCGLCKDCKHFEYSEDYNNVGDCNHPKFSEGIVFQNCDDMYVSEDFGCINYEISKLPL